MEKDREVIERYRRRLEVYAHLIEERHGYGVGRMHLYYTAEKSGNPLLSFNKNNDHIDKTVSVIDKTVQKIEVKYFGVTVRP